MPKTATVSDLRSNLAKHIQDLENDPTPLLVLQHGRQAAVMTRPGFLEELIDRIEFLEDLIEGRKALANIRAGDAELVDADDLFKDLGIDD